MTAPTEAEIRAHVEATSFVGVDVSERVEEALFEAQSALEDFIQGEHVNDEDYGVYIQAMRKALHARMPDLEALLRPILGDVQTEAVVTFFARFPDAPLAKREAVSA